MQPCSLYFIAYTCRCYVNFHFGCYYNQQIAILGHCLFDQPCVSSIYNFHFVLSGMLKIQVYKILTTFSLILRPFPAFQGCPLSVYNTEKQGMGQGTRLNCLIHAYIILWFYHMSTYRCFTYQTFPLSFSAQH